MLSYTELQEYIKELEQCEDFKNLKKYKGKFYVYKGVIIDCKWLDEDLKDETSKNFEPYYNKGYTRIIGDGLDVKYDYVPDFLWLDFEKDIEKYKSDIIKYIDKIIELKTKYKHDYINYIDSICLLEPYDD